MVGFDDSTHPTNRLSPGRAERVRRKDPMYTLYSMQRSGNSYKVRLALAQLRIPYRLVEIDILKGESRTPEFLAKNPNGQVPLPEAAPSGGIGIVAPTGKAGSVLMFHGNLVHGSSPNITPYPRKIVYLTLCAVSNHITKFTRPEWIAHRDFTPIVPVPDDALLAYANTRRVAEPDLHVHGHQNSEMDRVDAEADRDREQDRRGDQHDGGGLHHVARRQQQQVYE